ncbi:MAG: hypothetical protein K2X87_27025 [Gemmataceae bacterium]|nr:hypothetical protein [Gemmataceae bacterium]
MLALTLALRLARRLDAAWAAQAQPPLDPGPAWRALDARLAEAHRARHRVGLAAVARLTLTLPRLTAELTARLDDLARQVEQLRAGYVTPAARAPDLADWVAEVRQLEAEFGAAEVKWADRVIRVVTEPVVLRGVPLGPFAVEFAWDRAGRENAARCFDVVALDPHPASGRDEVTHPHVDGDTLCAGDAATPLAQAVADGRLADAFLLVRSVLTTYNPRSAYVPLAEWDGFSCADCGRRADRDDRCSCGACDRDLCEDCADSCAACSETRCGDCLEPCDVCSARHCRGSLDDTPSGRAVCPDCLATCARCSASVPRDELTAGTRLCPTCDHEEDEDTDDDDPTADAAAEASPDPA